MSKGQRAVLNVAEVAAAAGAFILGSTFGYLGAFVAGCAFVWAWLSIEDWADALPDPEEAAA